MDIFSTTSNGRKVSTSPPALPPMSLQIGLMGLWQELQARVRSVTVHGSIYKLRRMAQLLDPDRDFSWLIEIEKDLASAMQPKSKFGRFAYSHVLIKAGTDLMTKAEAAMHRSALARARQFRNGLMVAMLGYHPIRPKNFATLLPNSDSAAVSSRRYSN
jgi:hypothetical protein